MIRYSAIAPRIVGVGDKLSASRIIYRNDIALQVLFEPIGIEYTFGIGGLPVLHTNGRTLSIIEVQQEIVAPLFPNDLGIVDVIGMYNPVDSFACSQSICIIGITNKIGSFGIIR